MTIENEKIIEKIGFGVQPHPQHGTGALAVRLVNHEHPYDAWRVKLHTNISIMTHVEAQNVALNLLSAVSECRRREEELRRLALTT
jgi:hypothetical protein